jgi:hypothetical protein
MRIGPGTQHRAIQNLAWIIRRHGIERGSPAAMTRFANGSSGPFQISSSHFLPSRIASCSAGVNSTVSTQASVVAM